MKSIIKWYSEIEDPGVREKALKNLDSMEADTLETCLSRALHHGFDWGSSIEGIEYWDSIVDEILLQEGW